MLSKSEKLQKDQLANNPNLGQFFVKALWPDIIFMTTSIFGIGSASIPLLH